METATFQYERDPENPKIIYVPFDNSEFSWMPDRIQITLLDDPPVQMDLETTVEEPLLQSEEVWQIVKNYYNEIGKPIPKKVREDCLAEIAREKDLRANPPPPTEFTYIPTPSMDDRPEYGTPEFWKWYSKNKAFFQAKKKAAAEAKAAKEAAKEAKEKEKEAKQREIQLAKAQKLAQQEAKRKAKEEKDLAKQMAKLSIK